MPQKTFAGRKATGLTALGRGSIGGRRLLSSASVLALVLSAGLASSDAAQAADWTGATSTDWFVTGNWSGAAVPTAGDLVNIDTVTPNPTVINGASAVAQDLFVGVGWLRTGTLTISNGGTVSNDYGQVGRFQGSTGTVTVTGVGSSWTNAADLSVGFYGTGTLNIANAGTVSSADGFIGAVNSATGTVTVTGIGSTWTNSGDLYVGKDGTGTLNILNGGKVSNGFVTVGFSAGSSGTVTVDGAGSTWTNSSSLTVGDSGSGTLTISNGGAVTNNWGYIGGSAGSQGAVTVDGVGSIWTNNLGLTVGVHGTGTLAILNGGVVSNPDGYIGAAAGSNGIVTVGGLGSSWTNSGNFFVGDSGSGTLNILNGGMVSNAFATVGNALGAQGTVVVDGVGSTWANNGDLSIGWDGKGTLAITNGGKVNSDFGGLGVNGGSTGTALVSGAGSTWTNVGNLIVGVSGTSALTIKAGGAASNLDGFLGYDAGSTGTAVVDGAGSTWMNGGTLAVGRNGSGMLTISNGGLVTVGGVVTIAAQAGSTGTLNIGGAAGSAATAAGTLNASNIQFGPGAGAINFNHTDTNYTFASAIGGVGTINQIAGNTNLTADSSAFTGATNVSGGRLAVNGSLTNSLVTISGGVLGGNGTVGGIAAQSGGIIAPGNSIGTLNVAGDVDQEAGSVYQAELTSIGQSDLIQATGTATLAAGAVLDVVKTDAAPYVAGTHYLVLQADGGVAGNYTLTGDIGTAFLGLADSYDANHVYLDVIQKTFAQVGLTPNQIATGGGAESLGTGNPLYDAIAALPTEATARAAFDQLSGEIHASAKGMLLEDSRFIRDAATNRIDAAFGDAGAAPMPVMAYGEGGPEMVAADTDRFAVWGQAFGSWGNTGSDGNAAAFGRSTGGLLAGADSLVGDWRIGLLGGYSHSSFDADARNSSGNADSYHVGLYGGTNWGAIAFRSGAAYSWNSISTKRSVAFSGFADQLSADYDAGTAQVFGELAYKADAGRFKFEPFANLAYVSVHTDGFTEKGGGAALTSARSTTNATFTTLGLRASTDLTLGNIEATARGTLGWRHAFGDVTPTSALAFAGGGAFTISGVPIARDSAVIEAGFDLPMSANATLGLSYTGQFGSHTADNGAKANLNVKF